MNQNKQSQLYSAEALRLNSHKTMRKLFLAVFAFFMTATLTFLITQNMKNTNAASFQAGNIMSDAVMGNYNSMSEADIQNFLKSKNSCNKYSSSAGDYSETYGSKTYTWHVRNHRYVCMADDTFNGESAAHIIYTVAHEYRINPQVLIVLLQKEQGLITDQFPNSWQYNKAAGFGCPDTAPCDAQYYGLRTQLSKAANLFRTVLDGGWSNYPVGNNYVQYHPNQACGGSVINIENRATSALYRYTPYQPNGALLCGGSDGCSSYGNYNFYKYFTDWFGDTHDITLDIAYRSVEQRHNELGGSSGILGEKVAYINCNIGHYGSCVQAYKNGIIVYNPKTGAWENYGDIRTRFVALGSIDSSLGFPIGPMNCNIGHKGACVQAFQRGVIISNPATGTWENFGMARTRYLNLGGVDGKLGFPTSAENCKIDNDGSCVQAYENGVIIANRREGAWESYGDIRKRFVALGSIDGVLGLPIGPMNCNIGYEGACVQAYKGGVIISKVSEAWENYGAIRSEYIKTGSVDGKYGFPTGPVQKLNGTLTQSFEGGTITGR